MFTDRDLHHMTEALKEAQEAFENDETPVGAVIVCKEKVIAKAHNQVELLRDPTAHAEILALTQAADYLDNWRLNGVTLYVTKEPCLMCLGAALNARILRLVYGASDDQNRGIRDLIHPGYEGALKELQITGGVHQEACQAMLQDFFKKVREEKP